MFLRNEWPRRVKRRCDDDDVKEKEIKKLRLLSIVDFYWSHSSQLASLSGIKAMLEARNALS